MGKNGKRKGSWEKRRSDGNNPSLNENKDGKMLAFVASCCCHNRTAAAAAQVEVV